MGYYTGKEPSVDQSFIERVANALDLDPFALAKVTGVDYADIEAIWPKSRGETVALDSDIMWTQIAEYVDKRIGQLVAVREEFNRKLLADRAKRAVQHARVKNR